MGRGMESELIVVGMEFQMGYNYKCNEFIHSNTMRSGWRTLTTTNDRGEGQLPLAAGGGARTTSGRGRRQSLTVGNETLPFKNDYNRIY